MSKILLINPPYVQYGGIEGHGGKNTPLNLAYIASYLRENDTSVDVDIIDAEALELSFDAIYEKIRLYGPDIIGITCPTPVYYNVKKICSDIKEKDPDILIGFEKSAEMFPHYTNFLREIEVQNKLILLLTQQLEEAKLKEARDISPLKIVDSPFIPEYKARPKRILLCIGIVGVYLIFLFSII